MNLFDMNRRSDPSLVAAGEVIPMKVTAFGGCYRGFRMLRGARLRVKDPLRFYPFFEFPEYIGWQAWKLDSAGTLVLIYEEDGETPIVISQTIGTVPTMIRVPYPLERQFNPNRGVLVIACNRGETFLAINEVVDRGPLIAMCTGRGVEIGPGHQPQIYPSREVDVTYVEEKSREEWESTYPTAVHKTLSVVPWDRYVRGTARDIPGELRDLDFIFMSHVFEHLVNPLGHLLYWSSKLRAGGRLICIVPDLAGSKDYVFLPSSPSDWEAEYQENCYELTKEQYQRYAAGRRMDDRVASMMASRYSIHVHFYTPSNVARLLQTAVGRGWFTQFSIMHRPNNKDFSFIAYR